jgi:Protein of unknown function (DUF3168)
VSADAALFKVMRAALMEHAGVQAALGDPARVYDDPPAEATFPYVTLGRIETRPADVANAEALEHVVTLHAWSRYGGRAEALDVIAAMRAALHNAALAVEGHRLVLLLATFSDVFRSGDGRTTHGVLRLRAITEPQ